MSAPELSSRQLNSLRRMAFILVGAMLLLKLYMVFTAPVHIDSNYYLNIGSNFIERGKLSHHMWRLDDTDIIAGGGTGYGVLVLVAWFRLFGLSVISGELFSYIASILALIALYYTVKRWQDERTALFSVVFAASCGPFFVNFFIRMDSIATLFYILVLLLHVIAVEQKKTWLHFAVGVTAIASAEFHILALVYVVGFSFYYLYLVWQQKRLPSETIAFFLGAFVAGCIYLAVNVLPNIQQYLLIPSQCPYCVPFGPKREIARFVEFFVHYPIELILFALAIVGAVRRKTQSSYHYLLITIGAMIGLMVFAPSPQTLYTGHLWPLMAIGVGMLFAQGLRRGDFIFRRSRQIQLFVVLVLFCLQIIRPPYVPVQTIPEDVLDYLHRNIPRQTVIMGSVRTYYQLLDYPEFMTYRDDERYGLELRGEDYLTYWQRENPQVFIGQVGDDQELLTYLQEKNFTEALPNLWISQEIRQSQNL